MAVTGQDLNFFRRSKAAFEAMTSFVDGGLYFIYDYGTTGIILQYIADDDKFEQYGGGGSGTSNLDGGRASEVYQTNDEINGGGAE